MKKLKTIFSITALIAFALLAISCGRKKNIKTDSKTEVVSKTANENLPDISGYAIVGTNQKTFYNNTKKQPFKRKVRIFTDKTQIILEMNQIM